MSKRVINLVRHCESVWHLENRYAGVTDIGLSDNGKAQAKALVNWADSIKVSRIISSDLKRAVDSATPLAKSLKRNVEIDSRFREVDFGDIEGLTPQQMMDSFPSLRHQFIQRPAETSMPNGESGVHALRRATLGILDCLRASDQGEIMIFTHGTIMRLIVCEIVGLEVNDYRRSFPKVPNLGRFTVEIDSSALVDKKLSGGLLRFDQLQITEVSENT